LISFSLKLVFFAFKSMFSHSFFRSISSSSLWGLSWMNRNSGHRPHSFLAATDRDLFDMCLGSTVNNFICASAPNPNYRLHPLTYYLQFPPQCRRPCCSRALPLWTVGSSSNSSKAALRRRFLFDKPNQQSPLLLRHQPLRFASPLLPRNPGPSSINLRVSRARFAGRPRGMTNMRNRGRRSTLVLKVATTMTPFHLHHDASHPPQLFQIFLRTLFLQTLQLLLFATEVIGWSVSRGPRMDRRSFGGCHCLPNST